MRVSFTLSCRTNKDRQDMSWHILLYLSYGFFSFSSLFKSTVLFIYGIYLIIPAQGTNSKYGISALTISTIQFFMVSQNYFRWRWIYRHEKLIYLAYDLLHRYACQKVNFTKK